jgi:hypothetical protein
MPKNIFFFSPSFSVMKKLFSSRVSGFLLGAGMLLLGTSAQAQVSIDKTNWNIAFQDEFDDPSTIGPNSTKWSNGYSFGTLDTPVLSQLHYATWNNINVHDGVADFIVRDVSNNPISHNGKYYNYTTGAITCKFDDKDYSGCLANPNPEVGIGNRGFLYGMFEIRCRVPKGNGQLAAFWMYGASRESDIFEFNGLKPNEFTCNQHYPDSTFCQTSYTAPEALSDDYHVYTLVWTPTAMTYFLDGREVRTDTSPTRYIPGFDGTCNWNRMVLCIDAEVFYPLDPADVAIGANHPFSVDYVRVYKPVGGNYSDNNYKASTAINAIHPLNSSASIASKQQNACFSFSTWGAPTRDLDARSNQQLFFRSNQNTLTQLSGTGNFNWSATTPDPGTTNVAGNVTCSKNSPNVFYSDAQGHMWTLYDYYGWASACLDWGVNDVSNNVVLSSNNLYYRTTGGGLSYFWFDNSTGWHHAAVPQVNGVSPCLGSIAVVDDYVFYKTTNNLLYYVLATPTGWSNPVQVPSASNVRGSIAIWKQPSSNSNYLGDYRVYYIGTDNSVSISYIDNGQWVSWGLNWRFTNAASDLVVSPAGDQVYYKGTDSRLWNYYYYEGGWRNRAINYDSMSSVQGELTASSDGRIFFTDTNNIIQNAYPTPSRFVNPPCGPVPGINISNRMVGNSSSMATAQPTVKSSSASTSHSASKTEAVQVVVYDVFSQKILAKAKTDVSNPITRKGLGLAPGFYILHYLDANERVVRIEKIVFAE